MSLYSKANKIITHLKFIKKARSKSKDSLEKIYHFHREFNNLGLGANFKTNENAGTTPEAQFGGKKCLMFASNNYLGLSTNQSVINKAGESLSKHGIGPGGSRFLCGNLDILEELDRKTAELVGAEDAITFPTGYMANLGIFQGVMDPLVRDLPFTKGAGVIFSDEYNHGSIVDGCRLSYAKKIAFRHNDLEDLERKLIEHQDADPKMIVTEGVFTPHGDMAPLPEIVKIAKRHGAMLMVDDAHGIGVLGKRGGGSIQHFGLENQVDILMGSYDKALGGMGGFIAGKKELIDYLRIASRPYIFSSSVPAVIAGGIIECIDQCINDPEPRRILFENANYLRRGLMEMGYKILGSDTIPVVLVYIGDENLSIEFSEKIFEAGVYCPSFRWPAVPQGESRIRITPMATHTREHLDTLLKVFNSIGREMDLI
jgi:8-amino-7-oxononanoate synthase